MASSSTSSTSSSYVPYIPDNKKWENHFENMADRNYQKPKDFYVVRSSQVGSGSSGSNDPILVVSPVQQDVGRAQSDLKDENINSSHLEEYNQSHFRNRKRNSSSKKSKTSNSNTKKRFKTNK